MKTRNSTFGSNKLSREQMKKVTGGINYPTCQSKPTCGPVDGACENDCSCNKYGDGNPDTTLWLCEGAS